MTRPVLWIGLTDKGRTANQDAIDEHLMQVRDAVQEAVGDEYIVVAADDKTRLLDANDIRELLNDAPGKAIADGGRE